MVVLIPMVLCLNLNLDTLPGRSVATLSPVVHIETSEFGIEAEK